MLVSLYAENVALIKKLNITVGAGFTVLTGETGGGKSIIVDSMALLCGARGDKTLIRTGEDQATVEGVFDVSGERAGDFAEFAGEDGLMSVYRRITADGRSICRINGRTVPVNRLKELVSRLLNIHGQQDTQSLSDPQTHIGLLDTYAGDSAELASYREQYEVYTAAYAEAERMRKLAEEKMLRLDVLDYQINELENASVRAGEESELEGERSVLVNYEKIYDNVRGALEELKGRDSALSKIGRANDSLRRIENVLAGSS
ncbi:MAG: AAA family ATPase, partial [Clostridia bacterium]|nr:AAA family ATPase [Clostridia bacterium]